MLISIVIPTYNRKDTLVQCLRSVSSQSYPDYEVIVVDDGSGDGTDGMVQQNFPHVRYLRQDRNRGPAAARNRGIWTASGEVVAFTDDDCLVPEDWLSRLADGYKRHPQVSGVGGYLEAPSETLRQNILAQYERHVGIHLYGAGDREALGGFECPAGGTNNMSYRRDTLLSVDGFDESFPYAAGEDADLKWRICSQGASLLYVPVKVTHLQPYRWSDFRRRQITFGRGAIHFELKRHGRPPGRLRVGLRLMKRSLRFFGDLASGLSVRLAAVRLAAGWFECMGQLSELKS